MLCAIKSAIRQDSTEKQCQLSCLDDAASIGIQNVKFYTVRCNMEEQHSGHYMSNKVFKRLCSSLNTGGRAQWQDDSYKLRSLGFKRKQVGVSYSFLERADTDLPHLVPKWLVSVRKFLESCGATSLQLHSRFIPPFQRTHDFHIMNIILDHGNSHRAKFAG